MAKYAALVSTASLGAVTTGARMTTALERRSEAAAEAAHGGSGVAGRDEDAEAGPAAATTVEAATAGEAAHP